MTAQTRQEKLKESMAEMGPFAAVFGRANPTTTMALDLAVYGCLMVGVVGIIKAVQTPNLSGILICLLVSIAAFGTVINVRLRKR